MKSREEQQRVVTSRKEQKRVAKLSKEQPRVVNRGVVKSGKNSLILLAALYYCFLRYASCSPFLTTLYYLLLVSTTLDFSLLLSTTLYYSLLLSTTLHHSFSLFLQLDVSFRDCAHTLHGFLHRGPGRQCTRFLNQSNGPGGLKPAFFEYLAASAAK